MAGEAKWKETPESVQSKIRSLEDNSTLNSKNSPIYKGQHGSEGTEKGGTGSSESPKGY